MIKLNNVQISYQKNKPLLKNINLTIPKSSRIGIVGPNGAGKTSLVEAIMGLNKNFSGNIFIQENYKNNIKNVFQEVNYDRELSLGFMYYNYGRIAGLDKKDLNIKVFDKYNLSSLVKSRYDKLSGGEKQKFKLLMALEFKPKLLIVDEVSTSLDSIWKIQILNIIKGYLKKNPETILILVSHDLKELEELTEEVFLIKNQNLIKVENIESYFKDFENNEVVF